MKKIDTLANFDLKKTKIRKNLLALLEKNQSPLSQSDIIKKLTQKLGNLDRVTIYRNLNQMKKAGLVHELEKNKYILCKHECEQHPHLTFFCINCEKHKEVSNHEDVSKIMNMINEFSFFGQSNPISFKGLCLKCSK